MRKFTFLPLEEKAKASGLSAAAFRAQILTNTEWCWVFVSDMLASGSQDEFLPAYDSETSPFARWRDEGSSIEKQAGSVLGCHYWGRYKVPSYRIYGWVVLDPYLVEQVLVGRTMCINKEWIYVIALDISKQMNMMPLCAEIGDTERLPLTSKDLYFIEFDSTQNSREILDPRERATLLCIIGALATNAKLDLKQPMKAGDAIAAMMPDVRISGRTIGEHLKAAREAMESRKT